MIPKTNRQTLKKFSIWLFDKKPMSLLHHPTRLGQWEAKCYSMRVNTWNSSIHSPLTAPTVVTRHSCRFLVEEITR